MNDQIKDLGGKLSSSESRIDQLKNQLSQCDQDIADLNGRLAETKRWYDWLLFLEKNLCKNKVTQFLKHQKNKKYKYLCFQVER